MGSMDSMIAPTLNEQLRHRYTDESARKGRLRNFARGLAAAADKRVITDCEGFAQVVNFAAMSVGDLPTDDGVDSHDLPAYVMMDDLYQVLIGSGMMSSQRNKGPFALPFQAFLDRGFKKEFQDGGNQVQHAFAGIWLGYHWNRLVQMAVHLQEDGEADMRLYDATFPMGRDLGDDNYLVLSGLIRSALLAS